MEKTSQLSTYTYIICAFVLLGVKGTCDYSTCGLCTEASVDSQSDTCRWCPLSRECHAAADSNNPCAGSVKLDISETDRCPEDLELTYNSTAAYHHVLLSAATYSEVPDQCLAKIQVKNPLFDYQVFDDNFIARRCDNFYFDYKMCVAIVAISHINQEIVISYRGTAENLQLLDEGLVALLYEKKKLGEGSVQTYFLNAFEKLQPCTKQRLLAMIDMFPTYTITISGHSLGGAMASISAFNIMRENIGSPAGITLFTYGHPRVGDKLFSIEHDRVVPNSWRIVHRKDIVPHIPHCSPSCDSGGSSTNYHHGTEVFYDVENMTDPSSDYKLCRANHDITCSRKYTQFFSWNSPILDPAARYHDHLRYFGIPVGSYCNNLLGIGSRKKRDVSKSLYNMLRSDKCMALINMNGTWVPKSSSSPQNSPEINHATPLVTSSFLIVLISQIVGWFSQ